MPKQKALLYGAQSEEKVATESISQSHPRPLYSEEPARTRLSQTHSLPQQRGQGNPPAQKTRHERPKTHQPEQFNSVRQQPEKSCPQQHHQVENSYSSSHHHHKRSEEISHRRTQPRESVSPEYEERESHHHQMSVRASDVAPRIASEKVKSNSLEDLRQLRGGLVSGTKAVFSPTKEPGKQVRHDILYGFIPSSF